MYEDKKFKLNINWLSLFIKLGILLVIVFIICFMIFRPKSNKNFVSLEANITSVKEAAIEYFKNNMSLENIGDYDKVTLKEIQDGKFISSQEDNKGNTCDNEKSYAYLSKVRDDEFILKINMYCGKNEESKVYNLTTKDLTIIASNENDDIIEEDNKEENVINKNEEEILVDKNEPSEKPNIKEEQNEEDKVIADSSTSNKETIDFGNDELLEELRDPNNNKKIMYKHVQYGEWIEGTSSSRSIEKGTKTVNYYKFCIEGNCIVDRYENKDKYTNYTSTYSHTETVDMYRYVYVIWSDYCCIKGFTNTGIFEYR